jgi:hypothetical protein
MGSHPARLPGMAITGDGTAVGTAATTTMAGDGLVGTGVGDGVVAAGASVSVGDGAGGAPVGPHGPRSGPGRLTTTIRGSMAPGFMPTAQLPTYSILIPRNSGRRNT